MKISEQIQKILDNPELKKSKYMSPVNLQKRIELVGELKRTKQKACKIEESEELKIKE